MKMRCGRTMANKKKATPVDIDEQERRRIYSEFMKDYPHIEPCIRCRWWREAGNGALYKGNHNIKYIDIKYRMNYACYYHLAKDVLREDKIILYTQHKCKYFEEVKR